MSAYANAPEAGKDPPNLEPLVAALLVRAPRMNFMQLCRLLEVQAPQHAGFGTCDTAEHEPVRFRPRARTGFPTGEIAAVEVDNDRDSQVNAAVPTVRTTFMGLYGVDAAMPSHMIDEIVLREEGHEVVEAFLDQFNHRFVTLLYRTWKKYRYPESFRAGGTDPHSRNLLCLAGFGWGDKPQRAGLPDARMLALLGLLIQRTRTPEGLAGVIALAVPGVDVRVDEFFPALARAGKPQALTSSAAVAGATNAAARRGLGGGYVLGKRLAYRSRAVRVTLRPANPALAHDLLPGASLHRELMAFVRLYVGLKADVHLRMEMSIRHVPAPAIGSAVGAFGPSAVGSAGSIGGASGVSIARSPAPRLGWTTVLPAAAERLINVALGVYEALPKPALNPHLTRPVR